MKLMLTFLIVIVSACGPSADELTTFILVRHAEKADNDTEDPELTSEGVARAKRLAYIFKDTPVAAVYSTGFKRTENTAAPMADVHNAKIDTYQPFEPEEIEQMVDKHKGQTVLIAGHSNNIPWTANMLLGQKRFEDYAESEYGVILIVSVPRVGEGSVVRLNY